MASRCSHSIKLRTKHASAPRPVLSDQVKAAAEKAAADDSRSMASYVEKLLVEHLREKGYLADQSAKRERSRP
jgi:hypothetical protein